MDATMIVRQGIERWNAHDREGFLELLAEDAVFVDQATGVKLVGREEIGKGFWELWMEAYPDNQIKDAIVFAEGDLVCVQARFAGTNTGIFHAAELDFPPTGKPLDTPFVYIAEAGDGVLKHAWHYYDRLLAFEQEGILTVEKLFAQLPVV